MQKAPTIKDEVMRLIALKRVHGVVAAYGYNDGHGRKLQAMRYSSVEGRRSAMRILLGTWGATISYFQITTKRG